MVSGDDDTNTTIRACISWWKAEVVVVHILLLLCLLGEVFILILRAGGISGVIIAICYMLPCVLWWTCCTESQSPLASFAFLEEVSSAVGGLHYSIIFR